MPRISVLIPTHEHPATLPYAVRSVQKQGVDDLEILICGDGVGDDTRAVVAGLQTSDPRIRFFDLPKAPHMGQRNRDHVLRQAKGTIICVQNDDDLWLPGHIEAQERALADGDFVGAMVVNVRTDGSVRANYFDLERPEFVEPWLNWKPNNFGSWAGNGFGPIFVAFRLEAFLRLPDGWTPPPPGLPSDQAMWHKFVREPWCRAKFLRWPISLHFSALDRDRDGWTPQQRVDELQQWTEIIEQPDYAARIWRDLLPDLGDRLLAQALEGPLGEVTAAHEAVVTRMQSEQEALSARIAALEAELAAVRAGAGAQIADLNSAAAATREAVAERVRELEGQIAAVTRGASTEAAKAAAKVADAEAALTAAVTRTQSEQQVFTARIAALEAELVAVRAGAAAHIADLETVAAATREAVAERVRELEEQVHAVTRGASTEVAKVEARIADAEAALIHERALRVQAEIERDAALSERQREPG